MMVEALIKSSIPIINFTGPVYIDLFEVKGNIIFQELIQGSVGFILPHPYEMECNFMEYIAVGLEENRYEGYKCCSDEV